MAVIADAIIGELVTRLAQVVDDNITLITGIKDQIDQLLNDLKSFNAYLKQASKNQSTTDDNAVLKTVVDLIQDVVCDAEDAVGKYSAEAKRHRDRGIARYLSKVCYCVKVDFSAREIQDIIGRVKKIREDNGPALQALIFDNNNGGVGGQTAPQRMAPVVEEEDVVGFDDEAQEIKHRLLQKSTDLTAISIEGRGGLGKTTLAKMVFKDSYIREEFKTRAWVYLSENFDRKQIFMDILCNITDRVKNLHDMTEDSLAERIRNVLEGERYLIVVDDVCKESDWKCLKIAFPKNEKGSRILVTTRQRNVASHIDTASNPHQMKLLSNDECWELLEKKIFRKEKCPENLEQTGKRIAIKCNRLPLAVQMIANVLNKDSTVAEWKQVAEDPLPVINEENQSYNELAKLSYNHLPYNLKKCFLCLAAFPKGHDIATRKLIHLWIAEGFVTQVEGGYASDLERTAEKYMRELIDKKLLVASKRRADGGIKTCRIDETLHEFCKARAAEENLFLEMNGANLEANRTPRRLCVHSSIPEFLSSGNYPSGEHVRSFVSICPREVDVPEEHSSVIPRSFPLLRVMDVESLKFKMLPKELSQLYHLRHLAVSTELECLPKLFDNLWNLQTIVFNSSQSSVKVISDIWSMSQLRHVHSNTSLELPLPKKTSKKRSRSSNMQTLSTISPSSCTEEIFETTPNLLKLGVRGNLVELMESKGGRSLFNNLQKLDRLQNLKLINTALRGNSKLGRFPQADKFPRGLRKLTLLSTSFEWSDLGILGSFEELEVLKLEENAFVGEFCDVSRVVFGQLQYLRIESDDLVTWTVSKDSFPALKCLVLRNCSALDSVPLEFGRAKSLKVIELFRTKHSAAQSAQGIKQLKDAEMSDFQLSIYN